MHRIAPNPHPLRPTPLFWVALGLVALVGVSQHLGDRVDVRTLDYLEGGRPVIQRFSAGTHVFPALGIEISPPEGWTYLSVADDLVADRPTFTNETTHSILSLRRYNLRSWPPVDRPLARETYDGFLIEWIEMDHRCVGRLTQGNVDLMILVISHHQKAPRGDSIEKFCKSIRLISEPE